MSKRNWWERTSAADDGDIETEVMDRPSRGSSKPHRSTWLDDFDFEDARERDDRSSVSRLWGRWGKTTYAPYAGAAESAQRLASARRVVQGFVDTFATGDKPYRVVFDGSIQTAGTDLDHRLVKVSHAPLFDTTIDEDVANAVLTAMATHESAHVRYGIDFLRAAQAKWPTNPTAHQVANVLADVHDEAAFTTDYPGYEDVFQPGIDYVGRSFLRNGQRPSSAGLDRANLGLSAVRYPDAIAWQPEDEAERQWWVDWGLRCRAVSTVPAGLDLVQEALDRLAEPTAEQPQPQPQPGPGEAGEDEDEQDEDQEPQGGESDEDEDGDEETDGGSGEDEDEDEDEDGDGDGDGDGQGQGSGDFDPSESDGGEPTEGSDGGSYVAAVQVPDCWADALAGIAEDNGLSDVLTEDEAEELVEKADSLTDDGKGEVHWSPKGLSDYEYPIDRNGSAVTAIRAAFARSRTGQYGVERRLRSGRVDNRSLPRLGESDYRLFHRKVAQSEGRYRVWFLVDHSTSMMGPESRGAAQVAMAMAEAVRALPNVALDIFAWTDQTVLTGTSFSAVRVYANGEPVSRVGYIHGLPMGGTPDAEVLEWAGRAIQKHSRPGEQPVIIIASDGEGSMRGRAADLPARLRKQGVEVVSVAFGDNLRGFQERAYGPGGYIPWAGSIQATARPLGKLIGRIAAGRGAQVK